jgi:hypothetical protein
VLAPVVSAISSALAPMSFAMEARMRFCRVVRKFLPLDGGLHGAVRDLGHRALAGQIQIGGVFDFEPFLPVIGDGGSGASGHRRFSCDT